MANIKDMLIAAEATFGETIEAIVVGRHYSAEWDAPRDDDDNRLRSRDDGLSKLNQEYDNGYGGADCYPFYAWMPSRVLFMDEYDGSTGLVWVPRHPRAITPDFRGQQGDDE